MITILDKIYETSSLEFSFYKDVNTYNCDFFTEKEILSCVNFNNGFCSWYNHKNLIVELEFINPWQVSKNPLIIINENSQSYTFEFKSSNLSPYIYENDVFTLLYWGDLKEVIESKQFGFSYLIKNNALNGILIPK